MLLLSLPLVAASIVGVLSSSSSMRDHHFIKVYAEQNPISAPDEHLFLCPEPFIDELDLADWPRHEVIINGSECMNTEELLATEDNAVFFECLAETINETTYALDSIGIDASISDGTLLGWYRHHKGFIPWDVDGDISIMKSDCRESFDEYATPEQNNIANVVQELMPGYEVYGIKLGVGSGLEEDEWEGCENAEFRVYHVVNGTACHVDVFQQLQSTDPEEPCKACPGYLDGEVTVCRYPEGDVCGYRDDFFPMAWDHISWADCKIPHRPTHTLEPQVGGPLEFRNLKPIPGNYKYGEQILVVGRPVDESGREIALTEDHPAVSITTESRVIPITLPKLKSENGQIQPQPDYDKSFMSYNETFEAHKWSESFVLIVFLGALCSLFLIWLFCNYRHRATIPSHDGEDEVENRVLIS